jgi:predicted DsbA family dithiol-disulfide isomerase
MTITVDVISDVICPWCLVGKRRLERAVAAVAGTHDVVVRWHPFQLNPDMPREGVERRAYRTAKFGSWERSLDLDARLVEVGAGEGITFAFGQITRTPNTLDAHRLIRLAGENGIQDAVVEALFRAYFTNGRDISDRGTLLDVVAGAGLDRDRAGAELTGDGGLMAVRVEEEEARRIGVEGVPFFVVNGELALSGAQPPEIFLAAFERVSDAGPGATGGTGTLGPGRGGRGVYGSCGGRPWSCTWRAGTGGRRGTRSSPPGRSSPTPSAPST